MSTRSLLLVVVCVFVPVRSDAHGHRAEFAGTYTLLRASELDGKGFSISIPLCGYKLVADCDRDWSLVLVHSRLEGEHRDDEPGAETKDAQARIYLAGGRYTFAPRGPFVPFVHVLGGWVKTLEKGQVTGFVDRLGAWGSGGAATATVGVEVEFFRWFRLRVQYGGALFRVGDDTRAGHGIAFALGIGPHAKGHSH